MEMEAIVHKIVATWLKGDYKKLMIELDSTSRIKSYSMLAGRS